MYFAIDASGSSEFALERMIDYATDNGATRIMFFDMAVRRDFPTPLVYPLNHGCGGGTIVQSVFDHMAEKGPGKPVTVISDGYFMEDSIDTRGVKANLVLLEDNDMARKCFGESFQNITVMP